MITETAGSAGCVSRMDSTSQRTHVQARHREEACYEDVMCVSAAQDRAAVQCDVFSSGSSRMYQLSQSVREPPASVTVNARFSDATSQCCFARPASIATRNGFSRLSGDS